MNPDVITPPAAEPLTLTEAKLHMKIDHGDEDSYITGLIAAARRFCERYTHLALIEQTLRWRLNAWPLGRPSAEEGIYAAHPVLGGSARHVEVPIGPLVSVTTITTFDREDNGEVWNAANYYTSPAQNRIYRRAGAAWPRPGRVADGIEIVYTAGFGQSPGDVPSVLRQGLLQLIAHLYVHREVVGEAPVSAVPFTVTQMLDSFRRLSL